MERNTAQNSIMKMITAFKANQHGKEITSKVTEMEVERQQHLRIHTSNNGPCNNVVDGSGVAALVTPSTQQSSNSADNQAENNNQETETVIGNITIRWNLLRDTSNESSLASLSAGSMESEDRYSVSDSDVDYLEVRLNSFTWNDEHEHEIHPQYNTDYYKKNELLKAVNVTGMITICGHGDIEGSESRESTSSIEDVSLNDIDRYDIDEENLEECDSAFEIDQAMRQCMQDDDKHRSKVDLEWKSDQNQLPHSNSQSNHQDRHALTRKKPHRGTNGNNCQDVNKKNEFTEHSQDKDIHQSRDSSDDVDRYACCYGDPYNEDAENQMQRNNSATTPTEERVAQLNEQKHEDHIEGKNINKNHIQVVSDETRIKSKRNTRGEMNESIKNTDIITGGTKSKTTQREYKNTPGVIDTDVESDDGSQSSNDTFDKKSLL